MSADTTTLILDIETVPDDELYVAPDPAPGFERPFPPLYACRPIVVGVIWLDQTLACKRIGIVGEGKAEPEMMADLSRFVARYQPLLVTWNGRSFDLPVLALRALRHGVDFGWYYRGNGYRYRFSEEGHLDLGDLLADFGAARMTSLDGAARLVGLPGKVGVDGTQVEGLYRAGQIDVLRRYCLSDVAQTSFVFLRYRLISGAIRLPAYRQAVTGLMAALAADGRFQILLDGIDRDRLMLAGVPEPADPAPTSVPAPEGTVDPAMLAGEGAAQEEEPPPLPPDPSLETEPGDRIGDGDNGGDGDGDNDGDGDGDGAPSPSDPSAP